MQRLSPCFTRHALLLVGAIACSSDDATAPTQSIQIAVSSPSIAVERGTTMSLTASLVRSGGFAGPVTLAISGLPNGVSVTFTPDELMGDVTTSTIDIVVSAEATPGNYIVTVTAAAAIAEVEATCLLTIIDPVTIYLSAVSELTAVQGQSVTTTIQITRTGAFDGVVSLTLAEPLPPGIAGTLVPAFTTGPTSTLTLTVDSSVAPGTYLIPVSGTSAVGGHQITIRLTVTSGQAQDFELIVEPSTLTVQAGKSVIGTVILIPLGGYDKYADLSLVSPPDGITAIFEWFWGFSADMMISVAPGVAPGSYELTLRGTAPVGTHDVGFRLIVTDAENFALTLDPAALSIETGHSGQVNVGITRVGGYNGVITLGLVNLPSGISGTFSPITVSANASVLTLTVSSSVPLATYSLTIRGTGTPIGSRDATLTLSVLGGPPSFSISAASPVTVLRGTSLATSIEITRLEGFAAAVTFSLAQPLPVGVQGSFQPAIATGNTTTLVLTVAASAPVGQYPIMIQATSGPLFRFVTIALIVTTDERPDFELFVQPNTITVKAGATVTGNVILVPLGGYDKFADLSLVAPPAGITAQFEWFMDYTAAMIITVAPTVTPAAYDMILRGTAPVGTHDAAFKLIVTATESVMKPLNAFSCHGHENLMER